MRIFQCASALPMIRRILIRLGSVTSIGSDMALEWLKKALAPIKRPEAIIPLKVGEVLPTPHVEEEEVNKTELLNQYLADARKHEGFRQYAYPDPLSALGKIFPASKYGWGAKPAREILNFIGQDESKG